MTETRSKDGVRERIKSWNLGHSDRKGKQEHEPAAKTKKEFPARLERNQGLRVLKVK